jgi:MYXO-CTERM domain-containing protein
MRWARFLLPFAFVASTSTLAWADAGPRCKCTIVGVPGDGALAGGMLAVGGALLLVARRRRS